MLLEVMRLLKGIRNRRKMNADEHLGTFSPHKIPSFKNICNIIKHILFGQVPRGDINGMTARIVKPLLDIYLADSIFSVCDVLHERVVTTF